MTPRDEVLRRIRRALQDRPQSVPEVHSYLSAGTDAVSLERFTDRVEDYRARVYRCAADDVAAVLGQLVRGSVVVPAGFPEPWLTELGDIVRDEPLLSPRQLDAVDAVLTLCAVGIAETGTVVLDAGPGQGRRALSLVPDHHVVIARAEDIVAGVPDAIARLDATRPQTWISGPSATSDIELDRVEGVHGPRRLDVVLVGPET